MCYQGPQQDPGTFRQSADFDFFSSEPFVPGELREAMRAGISLEQAIGAARALYREQLNPMITLKALTYFADGDLRALPPEVQRILVERAARFTRPDCLQRISDSIAP